MTLDKDEAILKKYDLLKQPIPFPSSNTPENVAAFYKRAERQRPDIVDKALDALFLPPQLLFNMLAIELHRINTQDNTTITSKVLSVEINNPPGHLASTFMTFFAEREVKFFSNIQNSYLYTDAVERGISDIDTSALMYEQQKVMLDVLKKTYFSNYRFEAEEKIHDNAFYLDQWRGVDFLTLPPFVGAYLYYRGIDKGFQVLDTRFHIQIEPASHFLTGKNVIGAFVIEWKPTKTFPIGIVASTGMYNSKPEFEFIGIGSSIGVVQQAIASKGFQIH